MREPLIEHICGEFGFAVKWTFEYESSVQFVVYRVETIEERPNEDVPLYWKKGSSHNGDCVPNIDDAESYLDGSIKWDGCANIKADGYTHFCNAKAFKKHCELLKYLYEKAASLLASVEFDDWEKA